MPHAEGALERMFKHQAEMQVRSFGGVHPNDLGVEEKIQFLKDMTLALEDELHESMQEYGWKPWSTRRHIDVDPLKGELVDAWHFFMNLCIAVGMTPEELTDRYFKKAEVNRARQEVGYDNTNKCPNCRRALDDFDSPCPCTTMTEAPAPAGPGFKITPASAGPDPSGRLINEDYVLDMITSERDQRATEVLEGLNVPEALQGVIKPIETKPSPHNHMTRDIKRYGQCPGCDVIHDIERARHYSYVETIPVPKYDTKTFVTEVLEAAQAQIDDVPGVEPPVIAVAIEHLASLDQYINLDPDVSIDAAGGVVFGTPSSEPAPTEQGEEAVE